MSTDYYLVSPLNRRRVMVGSENLAGISVRAYIESPELEKFLRWAIDEGVRDIQFVSEDQMIPMAEEDEWA